MNKKLHVSLNVSDLEKSVAFYQAYFGHEPTKLKPDYAKFDLSDPPVNFTLNQVKGETGLSHLGVQVYQEKEVTNQQASLNQKGVENAMQPKTTCCYAEQKKLWASDPDGQRWETFFTFRDTRKRIDEKSSCCA